MIVSLCASDNGRSGMSESTLDAYLTSFADGCGEQQQAVAETIRALADAACSLSSLISQSSSGTLGAASGAKNPDGDVQRFLDVSADQMFLDAAMKAGIKHYCSEELDSAVDLNGSGTIALAIDPLDGSSNIATNGAIGSIFSLLPCSERGPEASFLQRGAEQLAAGFVIYGPQLAMVLSLGSGTRIFVRSPRLGAFVETASPTIPERTQEFAINASNYRHWDDAVRLYIDDCLKGASGPREKDFNMRWNGCLVAEAYRILIKGGAFLYPGDQRRGYANGRLRLVYEANPIALLVEQAGGSATDGVSRILDLEPQSLHQRIPLVFGSRREVTRIARYHTEPSGIAERSPLFGSRGLFRS